MRATQPDSWAALKAIHQDASEDRFLERLSREIEKRGALDVLRKGIKDAGCAFKLIYFAPATSMNPDYQRLYEGNVFSLATELVYDDAGKRLDLALFVNGLPIFTAELKNHLSGQNARHAMTQYKKDRSPKAALFRFGRCLGHFAVDNELVYVTTHLRGDKTFFLPFNKGRYGGAGNPPVYDNYAAHYLWDELWAPDSLLNLLSQFIHIAPENGGKKMIFPRYHQLDAVRRLLRDAREHGAGKRYLIQHNPGSGKSYSIAWLAHQLSHLHDARDDRVFDSVIVITDRRVLDRQLQASIRQFEQIPGLVENIDKTSRQLKQALDDGRQIIVATLQKFPMIVDQAGSLPGRRFAVIIDEAHSSQSGESAKSLKATLTQDSPSHADDDPDPPTWEDEIAASMRARKPPKNISMFAFTATPKNKTLELFGERQADGSYRAFSLYSMRQAIEEKFILDVLEHYITYKAYWRLLKTIGEDPEYESGKAKSLLRRFVESEPRNIARKVEIMVAHFHEHVARQIRGQAKAMIVTRSRLHALRYYRELKRCLQRQNHDYGALVAFSGEVDDGGVEFTEAGLNGFPDKQTANAFARAKYRFLVVAEKFQTGFDQPLLAAMYIDKPLKGVHAVQTLSRLNRIHPPHKESTVALDFVNQAQHIREAFQPYYEATILSESTDHNLLYDHERKLNDYLLYTQDEVDDFCALLYSRRSGPERLYPALEPALARFRAADADIQAEFRSDLMSYIRLYAFLSQVIPFEDLDLEKLYQFARLLRRNLPLDETRLPTEVLDHIDIDSFRLRKSSSGSLTPERRLEALAPMLENEKYGSGAEPIEPLSVIIQFLNEVFGADWERALATVTEVKKEVSHDISVQNAIRINPADKARPTVSDAVIDAITRRYKSDFTFFHRVNDDPYVKEFLITWIFDELQREIKETS